MHVTVSGLGTQYLPLAQQASIQYRADPAPAQSGRKVTFEVEVPAAPPPSGKGKQVELPTRCVVSSGEFATGTIYARGEGLAGNVIKMEFYTPLR